VNNSGFADVHAHYESGFQPGSLIGELRSIGPDGPTYEVLSIIDRDTARIRILESERDVDYPISEIVKDPGPDAAWKSA
jgi:hypothetical protein